MEATRHRQETEERERRASAAVRKLWGQLQGRRPADRALIVEALRAELERRGEGPREAQLVWYAAIFRQFVQEAGSAAEAPYRDWWRGHPDRADLPSADRLRKELGGPQRKWDNVKTTLECAYNDDVCVLRLLRSSGAATTSEIREAARAWATSAERPLTLIGFLNWCEEQEVSADPAYRGWVRINRRALYGLFGDWPTLLEQIGEPEEAARARERGRASERLDTRQLIAVMHAAHDELGHETLNELRFNRWVRATGHDAVRALDGRQVNWGNLERHFGSVPRALFQAGLLTLAEYAYRLAANKILTTDQQYATMAAFISERGERAPESAFYGWRRSHIDRAAERGELLVVAKLDTFKRPFDRSWPQARAAVLDWIEAGGEPLAGVIRDDLTEPV